MKEIETKLIEFAIVALEIMERDVEWSGHTVDEISNVSHDLGISGPNNSFSEFQISQAVCDYIKSGYLENTTTTPKMKTRLVI